MKINYSFKLGTQVPTPAKPPEKLVEYTYSEFLLELPEHWHQEPTAQDNTFIWASEKDGASITISADFYAVPDEKAMQVAQFCVTGRHEAMEAMAPGQVTVLQNSVKPHSRGGGLEIGYAATIPGHSYLFLGYVTPRKIFNFGLTCGPDHVAASELYNRIVGQWLRIKLP